MTTYIGIDVSKLLLDIHHNGQAAQIPNTEGLREGRTARNLTLRELGTKKKMHPVKAEIARRLRKETTMTWTWIAPRLYGGSPSTTTSTVYQLQL